MQTNRPAIKKDFWTEYYIYNANFSLAAGTGLLYVPVDVQMDSDADFQWIKTTFVATQPKVYIKMQDDTSGRQLMKNAVELAALAGQGVTVDAYARAKDFRAFVLPALYTFRAKSSITVHAANDGVENSLRMCFHGQKVRAGLSPLLQPAVAKIPFTVGLTTVEAGLPEGVVKLGANLSTTATQRKLKSAACSI